MSLSCLGLLGVLVQVHRYGYFLRRPPPTPPVLGDSGLVSLARVSPHPPASRAPPPEGPQSMVNFSGDFLGEMRFPASVLGHPKKIRAKIRATSVQTILASNPCRNPRKKSGKKPCKKSVQKIRAKNPCKKIRAENPCKKSVQKIRAENPCKKSVRNKPAQTASPK